jgi:hypothetical protein
MQDVAFAYVLWGRAFAKRVGIWRCAFKNGA